MTAPYGYYLPLSEKLFDAVRFLSITPKTEGLGGDGTQKMDKDGTPLWVVSALVKFRGAKQETEVFTLASPNKTAEEISKIVELTPITLVGLCGGKWSRNETDKTSWSFQISGIALPR
jgi:hypothetical protein